MFDERWNTASTADPKAPRFHCVRGWCGRNLRREVPGYFLWPSGCWAGERVADFSTGGNVYVLERGDLYLAASLSIGADDMPGERGRAAGQALFSTGWSIICKNSQFFGACWFHSKMLYFLLIENFTLFALWKCNLVDGHMRIFTSKTLRQE